MNFGQKKKVFYDSGKSSTDTLVRPSTTKIILLRDSVCEVLIKLSVITNNKEYKEI